MYNVSPHSLSLEKQALIKKLEQENETLKERKSSKQYEGKCSLRRTLVPICSFMIAAETHTHTHILN
jgi:hypothetical protein